jgi:hypothetical protein
MHVLSDASTELERNVILIDRPPGVIRDVF